MKFVRYRWKHVHIPSRKIRRSLIAVNLLTILSFSLISISILSQPTSAAFPGVNGRIAFYSNRDGSWQIYSMKPDGSDVIQLTFGKKDGEPYWSPDGSKIVFTGWDYDDPEIYLMNADGSGRKQLTFNEEFDGEPAWSPDGSKIVFISVNPNRDREIFLINPDGTNMTQLTFNMRDVEDPAWSPDGSKIVFNSNKDGDQEIYIMSVDGSDIRKLTDNSLDDWNPSWSPNGRKIAFTSNRGGYNEIYVMNPEGKELTQLTFNKEDVCPTWSPDGKKIAFIRFVTSKYPSVGWQVYVMNAEGKDQTRLTNTESVIFSPRGVDWRPNWQPIRIQEFAINLEIVPSDSGEIIFDKEGKSSNDIIFKSPGIYSVEAKTGAGYNFTKWETYGGLTVTQPNSEITNCVVWGDGNLRMKQTNAATIKPFIIWPWVRIDLIVYPEGVGVISSKPEPKYGTILNPWATFYKRDLRVEFTATPFNQTEWEFAGWEVQGGIKFPSNPLILTVQQNGYVNATFRRRIIEDMYVD